MRQIGFKLRAYKELKKLQKKWQNIYKTSFKNRPEWAVCLRAARYKNSLSQRELSKKSRIPITTISKYENGEREISITQAKKLAKALNTNYKIFISV